MAKIGTAHVEIKPVLDEAALEQIAARIEDAVRKGVEAGMAAHRPIVGEVHIQTTDATQFEKWADKQRRSGGRS